jgi:hypothetical protein
MNFDNNYGAWPKLRLPEHFIQKMKARFLNRRHEEISLPYSTVFARTDDTGSIGALIRLKFEDYRLTTNLSFQAFAKYLLKIALELNVRSTTELLEINHDGKIIGELLLDMCWEFGQIIDITDLILFSSSPNAAIGSYMHMLNYSVGILVEVKSVSINKKVLKDLADLASMAIISQERSFASITPTFSKIFEACPIELGQKLKGYDIDINEVLFVRMSQLSS